MVSVFLTNDYIPHFLNLSMKGALVFLIVFAVVLLVSLAVLGIPPGQTKYDLLGAEETDSSVLGIGATTLVVAVFDEMIYGVIAWPLAVPPVGSGL